jgi:predicted amidohydrolase
MLIRGGHLVDPAAGRDGIFDILVKDGVVAELAEWNNQEAPVWKENPSFSRPEC